MRIEANRARDENYQRKERVQPEKLMRILQKIERVLRVMKCSLSAKKFHIERPFGARQQTEVDLFWMQHTVRSMKFSTPIESEKHLKWRFSVYPLFREFTKLYQEHKGETILDYGCGPGNDVVGFALYSQAAKIIAMDVSEKALRLTQYRLALHNIDSKRIRLVYASDAISEIPLADQSVSYINCQGVLMHSSHPEQILKEFYRVLDPQGSICLMIYNSDSLWLHLWTAYKRMIIDGEFAGLDVYEAFSKNTDGKACPISRCYDQQSFTEMCKSAGFNRVEYRGGYLSTTELNCLHEYGEEALEDNRLDQEHRVFLSNLSFDARGLPKYQRKHAGIGGVYWLKK